MYNDIHIEAVGPSGDCLADVHVFVPPEISSGSVTGDCSPCSGQRQTLSVSSGHVVQGGTKVGWRELVFSFQVKGDLATKASYSFSLNH